ncbi:MAG: hypothetical protein GY810_21010 [Aureispira sp.]|nr:hypothetical protein [Aureispira sp.]
MKKIGLLLFFFCSFSFAKAQGNASKELVLAYHQQMLMQRVNKAYTAITFGVSKKANIKQMNADVVSIEESWAELDATAPNKSSQKEMLVLKDLWLKHLKIVEEGAYNKDGVLAVLKSNKELLKTSEEIDNHLKEYIEKHSKENNKFNTLLVLSYLGEQDAMVQRISTLFLVNFWEVNYMGCVRELDDLIIDYEAEMSQILEFSSKIDNLYNFLLTSLEEWQKFERECTKIDTHRRSDIDFDEVLLGSSRLSEHLEQAMEMVLSISVSEVARD